MTPDAPELPDFRSLNLAVFERRPLPHVFWQPRFEPWYWLRKRNGDLPAAFADMALPDLYDHCRASMRTVDYYTGQPSPLEQGFDPEVRIERTESPTRRRVVFHTPHGPLVEEHELTQDHAWREVAFPVRTPDDLRKLRWLFGHMTWTFHEDRFRTGDDFIGRRGWGSFWVPKSPYMALAQQWMRMEDLVYALADEPELVEDTMRALDASYDGLYEQLAASPSLRIINFGENIHEQLLSPRYWETYLMPFYERRCAQLRQAGIFTHIHIDGYFRNMLPYVRHLPHDGVEALTPEPQGDMTLEAIREHIGDKILLDGIPAVLFLDSFSREELMACVEKVVKYFHPRLVLGVSDEVPQGGSIEAMERVRMVGAWCLGQGPRPCVSP